MTKLFRIILLSTQFAIVCASQFDEKKLFSELDKCSHEVSSQGTDNIGNCFSQSDSFMTYQKDIIRKYPFLKLVSALVDCQREHRNTREDDQIFSQCFKRSMNSKNS